MKHILMALKWHMGHWKSYLLYAELNDATRLIGGRFAARFQYELYGEASSFFSSLFLLSIRFAA